MAEPKKKRQSIAEMKRELQAMQIASRRRQQGKKATGESVAKELKKAGSGQSSKPSDKSKFVSPQGKEYAGPGYGAASKPKPKPAAPAAKPKPKPAPAAAKPKPKPAPAAAKPKPKPSPSGTQGSSMPSNPPGMRQTRGKDLREKDPQSGLYINQSKPSKRISTPKKGDVKREGGQWKRWDGTKWVVTRSPY